MQEIANVYARALFEAARDKDALDTAHEQLAQFTDALADSQDLQVFFLLALLLGRRAEAGSGAGAERRRPIDRDFLDMLIENRRMPVLAATRTRFEELWEHENRLIPVEVTSAIELDAQTVGDIGKRIGEQTGIRCSSRAAWIRTSSAASSCVLATRSSTHRSATASTNYAKKSSAPPSRRPRRKEPNRTCRSTPTRSQASSRAGSKASTAGAAS